MLSLTIQPKEVADLHCEEGLEIRKQINLRGLFKGHI